MLLPRIGYGNVEHKSDRTTDRIGFDTGWVIEFAVLFKVYSNFLNVARRYCSLKTLRQGPAKHFTAILLKKRTDGVEIFPVRDSTFS